MEQNVVDNSSSSEESNTNDINVNKTLCQFNKWVFNYIFLQKTKLKVTNTGSDRIGQKGNSLKKVGIEQNLDDYSSSSEETHKR